jgi:hypothetical protein
MAGSHDDLRLVGIRDEIHGAAHAFEDFSGDHVVGQVAVGADLEGLVEIRYSFERSCVRALERVLLTPKMDTSTWPPRIIPKDSVLSNVAAPGTRVTVSLPALMMSLFAVSGLFMQGMNGWESGYSRINLSFGGICALFKSVQPSPEKHSFTTVINKPFPKYHSPIESTP